MSDTEPKILICQGCGAEWCEDTEEEQCTCGVLIKDLYISKDEVEDYLADRLHNE